MSASLEMPGNSVSRITADFLPGKHYFTPSEIDAMMPGYLLHKKMSVEYTVPRTSSPITDAIQFLRSHGMVVEYDTPPERLLMMADFLSENGKDMDDAVELFRSLEARELMREAEWERFFANHRQFEPALRHILDMRPPFVAINHRISFNTV